MVDVGDILVVRCRGILPRLIDLGAWLRHEPRRDHVAIVYHINDDGEPWVVEAEPGGVRIASGAVYVADPRTITNAAQPKTAEQRAAIAATATSFVDAPYDWAAITQDVTSVLDLRDPYVHEWLPGSVPSHVVCSSLASYVYAKVGLAEPVGGRFCTPADWARFILANHFV